MIAGFIVPAAVHEDEGGDEEETETVGEPAVEKVEEILFPGPDTEHDNEIGDHHEEDSTSLNEEIVLD